ncbi:hypothetical protein Enr17x_04590 [Gimesia fumaroli]|uniref:Uncharacterized protein n=1 Tax=Gimesia fumaroli TaxID=2527976 RepID=A0A518I5S9_9PLAN|nr:hypothetical protein Enr17x_04590 [Gimesia fumaroli]
MPNSNPACDPPSDVTCAPARIPELIEKYPYLCLDTSKFEPSDPEVTLLGSGITSGRWQGLSGHYNYDLICTDDDCWVVGWDSIFLPPSGGSEKATGGSFPNLIFPNFSTTEGYC